MPDERNASKGPGSNLGDRLARILAESAIKPGNAPAKTTVTPANDAEWHYIHAGKEFGPLSLVALVEKAATGEIEADDLVKKTGAMWTKARDVGHLQREFQLKESRERAVNQLGRFRGVWLSRKVLAVGGCALLIVIGLAAVWAFNGRTNPVPPVVPAGQPLIAEKKAPEPVLVEKKNPNPVAIEKVPDLEPKDALFFRTRGGEWLEKKEYDEAIKDFNEAIRLDPNRAGSAQSGGTFSSWTCMGWLAPVRQSNRFV